MDNERNSYFLTLAPQSDESRIVDDEIGLLMIRVLQPSLLIQPKMISSKSSEAGLGFRRWMEPGGALSLKTHH